MTTKATRITRDKMMEEYPNLAKILDRIYEKDKKKHYWFFVNYSGKYKDREGNPRAVSLGAIIELLQEYGFTISISASKQAVNKKLWEQLYK